MDNKMEQIAAMFDKKLGECFTAKQGGCIRSSMLCRFEKDGLQIKIGPTFGWINNPSWLVYLLTGSAIIVDNEKEG